MKFDCTPTREWTWWDHFVFKVTGRVTDRVYRDRLTCAAKDDARLRTMAAEACRR
jgi:hypothetical protein